MGTGEMVTYQHVHVKHCVYLHIILVTFLVHAHTCTHTHTLPQVLGWEESPYGVGSLKMSFTPP